MLLTSNGKAEVKIGHGEGLDGLDEGSKIRGRRKACRKFRHVRTAAGQMLLIHELWPLRILGSSRSGEEKWAICTNEGPYICSLVAITDQPCAIDVQSAGDKIRFGSAISRDQFSLDASLNAPLAFLLEQYLLCSHCALCTSIGFYSLTLALSWSRFLQDPDSGLHCAFSSPVLLVHCPSSVADQAIGFDPAPVHRQSPTSAQFVNLVYPTKSRSAIWPPPQTPLPVDCARHSYTRKLTNDFNSRCRRQFSKYTCPTCNIPYCSLTCFRSEVRSK